MPYMGGMGPNTSGTAELGQPRGSWLGMSWGTTGAGCMKRSGMGAAGPYVGVGMGAVCMKGVGTGAGCMKGVGTGAGCMKGVGTGAGCMKGVGMGAGCLKGAGIGAGCMKGAGASWPYMSGVQRGVGCLSGMGWSRSSGMVLRNSGSICLLLGHSTRIAWSSRTLLFMVLIAWRAASIVLQRQYREQLEMQALGAAHG